MNQELPIIDAKLIEKCRNFRVFISYSSHDRPVAEKVVGLLRRNGLTPVWDQNFAFGHAFHDQIKSFIAHAHVFLPLITKASSARGWVHQEIGYAMALNIPVLPVCYHEGAHESQTEPDAMLQHLQAVHLTEVVEEKQHLFAPAMFVNLVSSFEDSALALHRCSELREERAAMIAEYAQEAMFIQRTLGLGQTGHVRQRGSLTSFHIPDQVISDPIWKVRYERREKPQPADSSKSSPGNLHIVQGGPSLYHCKLQRQERLALEEHARSAGCSLIINPDKVYSHLSDEAIRVRLQCLVHFFESMTDANVPVTIATNSEATGEDNTTIVGDWFAAESVSMVGPRQTNFTTHAPSIQTRIEVFDQELRHLLARAGISPQDSLAAAIESLRRRIADLKRKKNRRR